nr:protein strictosidine synthase-like 10 [Ipomoea batatas]
MNPSALIFSAAALALLSILLAFNSQIVFTPPTIPASQDLLTNADIVPVPAALGPESIAFDPHGDGPYAGVADGRILKWEPAADGISGGRWIEFAVTSSQRKDCVRPFAPEMEHICGRPLGLRFDKKTGDLYIADAYLGLHVVGRTGGSTTPLVKEVNGQSLLFTNDMDIDEDEDAIYFTDTSTKFQRRQFIASVVSGDRTGRLMKYDRSTKEVTVLIEGIAFANGVALSKDRSFVLVAETSTGRVLRYWLKGPEAGNHSTFAVVPGFPDNIRRNSRGQFWVALHAKKGPLAHLLVSNPWLGKTLLKLPFNFKQLHHLLVGKPHASAIKLGEDGEVVEVLEDIEGKTLKFISEVEEHEGKLWIGSVLMPFLGVYKLP